MIPSPPSLLPNCASGAFPPLSHLETVQSGLVFTYRKRTFSKRIVKHAPRISGLIVMFNGEQHWIIPKRVNVQFVCELEWMLLYLYTVLCCIMQAR